MRVVALRYLEGATKKYGRRGRTLEVPDTGCRTAAEPPFMLLHQRLDFPLTATVGSKVGAMIDPIDIFVPTQSAADCD